MKKKLMVLSIVSIILTGCTSTYDSINLSDIKKDMQTNAMLAEETYNKMDVEITGKIIGINSSLTNPSFTIKDNDGNEITCNLSGFSGVKTKKTLEKKVVGDTVTVQGILKTNGHWISIDNAIIK